MQFLIRDKGGKKKAHYWNGKDTLCTMFSTGGMKRSVHISDTSEGHEICQMCQVNAKKLESTLAQEIHRLLACQAFKTL